MPFVSYAQNYEDVMLWRALGRVDRGFYIDVGAWDPTEHSVTRAFYDCGWSGINIEPIQGLLDAFIWQRPRDTNLAMAVGSARANTPFFVVAGTGLSTVDEPTALNHAAAGHSIKKINVPVVTLAEICQDYAPKIVHFLKLDCEGAERDALLGADFLQFRPWIVLVEATKPNSPEPNHEPWESILIEAAYHFVYFDGLNRFYIAAEQLASLKQHFETPPNVFDNFIKISEKSARFHLPPKRPSLAAATPPVLTEDQRVLLTASCRDADSIPKVEGAGLVFVQDDGRRIQRMHNGLKVLADGYYGPWMTHLITLCAGHHEPQEELCFHAVLSQLPSDAVMIELGGFWAYYTAWFLKDAPNRRAIVLEPDPAHRNIGQENLALNGLSAAFIGGFAANQRIEAAAFATEKSGILTLPGFSVGDLMHLHRIDHLDILHCDIQGAELDVLEGCRSLLLSGAIRWLFVSTHAWLISGDPLTHQRCLAFLRSCGAAIDAEHDVHESFSGDGLIVARFGAAPTPWKPIQVSHARYGESLFRNPSFDLAETREWDPRREFIGNTVRALYKTLLLREPDEAGLTAWINYLVKTSDPLQAVTLMLESSEFRLLQRAFRDRYFAPVDDTPSHQPIPNPVGMAATAGE